MHAKISPGDLVFRGWTQQGRIDFTRQRNTLKENGFILKHQQDRMDGDCIFIYVHPKTLKQLVLNLMN